MRGGVCTGTNSPARLAPLVRHCTTARRLTNTDNGETLVNQNGVLCDVAARPVGTTVTLALGASDGAGAEGGEVALVVVAAVDAAHC